MNWLLLLTKKSILEKSNQLLPLLANHNLSLFDLCGKCHVSCCRDLGHDYGYSEPSPVLWQGNDLFDFNVKLALVSLLSKLDIQNLDAVLHTRGMRWFGHVGRSDGRIAQVCKLHRRDNAGKKTLDEVLQYGRKKLGMDLATLKTGLNGVVVREEDWSESPTLGRGPIQRYRVCSVVIQYV